MGRAASAAFGQVFGCGAIQRIFCARIVAFAILLGGTSSIVGVEPANIAVDLNRPISGYALMPAFPGVQFNQPVAMAVPPGETNRLFVVEREGVIAVITNLANPARSVFLDLRERTSAIYIESGLLGLAFHPNYQSNGYFFVFRTVRDGAFKDRLARFRVSASDPNRADPAETVLIDQEDIRDTHNAGDLHFGLDGYLYLSVGDEAPAAADRRTEPQAIDGGLFGGIIRIDVDQRGGNLQPNAHPSVIGHYSIPADNPFIGATSFLGAPVNPAQVRTEFYAVGMRNPWRFTFDSLTGQMIVADVGFGWIEELNLVTKGGNYGWPYLEGTFQQLEPPAALNAIDPFYGYHRGKGLMNGNCIIGGIVCRDGPIADLEGYYIFGDEGSGNIWKVRTDDPDSVQWIARESHISAFERDPARGDVLVANFGRGELRRLVYVPPTEERIPLRLSATGIFTNLATLAPSGGLTPFEVNVPFWSDGAIKRRWFGLMDPSQKVGFSATENWTFPHGAVWVKHFDLELEKGNPATARRIETRLLVKSGTDTYGYTYRWNANGTDAELVPSSGLEEPFEIHEAGGVTRTQVWNYPARGDCVACHTRQGGEALGFNAAQLNLDTLLDGVLENQVQRLARAGYLNVTGVDPHDLPRLAKAEDQTQPLDFRVKSYLAANCSQCHQPGGVWGAMWDGRWSTPMAESGIVNVFAGIPITIGDKIIAAHGLTNSTMYRRITEPEYRMPPIGSTVLDDGAGNLMKEWILAMPDESFTQFAVGSGIQRGSVSQRGDLRLVSGIGKGMTTEGDRLHFLGGKLNGAGQIIARIGEMVGGPSGSQAGLMIRSTAGDDAAAVWLARNSTGRLSLIQRAAAGMAPALIGEASSSGSWLRLVRLGSKVVAWQSADAITWQTVGTADFPAQTDVLAGVAVASGEDWRYATTGFDNIQIVSVSLAGDGLDANLPKDIVLEAAVETNGVAVEYVDFTADGYFLGRVSKAPWTLSWTNAWAGNYSIVATAHDHNGLAIESDPVMAHLKASEPIARYAGATNVMQNWQDFYGGLGSAIPGVARDLPERTAFDVLQGNLEVYPPPGVLPDENSKLAATAWAGSVSLRFLYKPANELSHRLTLFFAQYANAPEVTVMFQDPSTGDLLDERVISGFSGGKFVSWAVRGAVEIQINSSTAESAHLEGVFLDPISPVNVRMLPVDGVVTLPATILLRAEASAQGREVRLVEFWEGEIKIGEDTTAPYEFAWTNALAGAHQVRATAVGEYGLANVSEPVTITCALSAGAVTFVGEDRVTQGAWIGPYGNSGHILLAGGTNMPPRLRAGTDAPTFVFSYWTDVPGSLQRTGGEAYGFAGCYVVDTDQPMEIRIATLDGRPARLALYFHDWLGPGRAEQVELFDVATGELLDRRSVTSFYNGAYLNWNVQGELRAVITSVNDYNTIVNAIFFDPPESFASFWLRQRFPGTPESDAKWAADPDDDGRPNLLEYAAGSDPLKEDPAILHTATILGDLFHVTARVDEAPSDARIVLEISADLVNWQDSGVALENGAYDLPYRLPTEGGGRFFRLRAELIGN